MNVSLFGKKSKPSRSKLESITIRGFGGGWNAVDDDLSMEPKYQVELLNLRRTPSGSQRVRPGSQWLTDIKTVVTGNIVDMDYFNGRLIVPTTTGQIASVTEAGVVTKIWDSAIAAALPGAPTGWASGQVSMDFVPWKDQLIIHNGIDKPIILSSAFVPTYLQDLATGSNVNVPIGRFGCIAANYHCIGGITGAPTTIYISAKGTAGTWPGDPAPNDAISIDVGAYAPDGAPAIRGIAGFRQFLLVFFLNQTLVVTLGVYTEDDHTPTFPDTMPRFGLLGHRALVTIENDLRFAGFNGVSSAKRNLFSGNIDSQHLSSLIEPRYRQAVGELTATEQAFDCFAVYNPLSHSTMLFLPDGVVFNYASDDKLRYQAWSKFDQPEYSCACTSFLGRVYAARGTRIYQVGNDVFTDEAFHADFLEDRTSNWATGTNYTIGDVIRDAVTGESFQAGVTHTSGLTTFLNDRTFNPTYWAEYEGEAISFRMELPWLDGKDPMKVKQLRFAQVGTKGAAEFKLQAYVDNLYKDEDGIEIYDPALEIDMIGNDAPGFGEDPGPYGGGRRSADPRLYAFPVKFKSVKFVIEGSGRRQLEFVNLSFLFSRGMYKR